METQPFLFVCCCFLFLIGSFSSKIRSVKRPPNSFPIDPRWLLYISYMTPYIVRSLVLTEWIGSREVLMLNDGHSTTHKKLQTNKQTNKQTSLTSALSDKRLPFRLLIIFGTCRHINTQNDLSFLFHLCSLRTPLTRTRLGRCPCKAYSPASGWQIKT